MLAYLALMAYGIALLKTRILPRLAAWLCIGFALLAVPWFGPPLLIHMVPWILGVLILTGDPPSRPTAFGLIPDPGEQPNKALHQTTAAGTVSGRW